MSNNVPFNLMPAARLARTVSRPCRWIAAPRAPRAFTLVELLVVLVIIGVLGSIVMFAMFGAQESAREAKTKNMISKLNALIMPRYESFMNRRVPIRRTNESDAQIAFYRLQVLRELMRLELPDRWTDVNDDPVTDVQINTNPPIKLSRPAVSRTYFRKMSAANNGAGVNETDLYQGAECLYLIVAFGLQDADGLTRFSQSDIGDTDGDGLLEFLDGWGQPISFIRWPAGFDSPRQSRNRLSDFDQFNPRGSVPRAKYPWPDPNRGGLPDHQVFDIPPSAISPAVSRYRQFALYPLIYSGGPDRDTDIGTTPESGSFSYSVPARGNMPAYIDPYAGTSPGNQVGAPVDDDQPADGLESADNIHNHDLIIR